MYKHDPHSLPFFSPLKDEEAPSSDRAGCVRKYAWMLCDDKRSFFSCLVRKNKSANTGAWYYVQATTQTTFLLKIRANGSIA